ncbi:hypothetical protein [Cellulomonas timonensis]|uniref:hypothetical protein n=1 Tax=Cellulomonas timonensis TaxID=1689271 RepID=UPI000A741F1D|nr:hypothetical protein [Cellulomonas timonensis]
MNDMWGQGLDAELAYRRERMLADVVGMGSRRQARDGGTGTTEGRVVEVGLLTRIRRALRRAGRGWGLTRSGTWAAPR